MGSGIGREAVLGRAVLGRAVLGGAVLGGAVLGGAVLGGAVLGGAVLGGTTVYLYCICRRLAGSKLVENLKAKSTFKK